MFASSKSSQVVPATSDSNFPYVPLLLETSAASSRSTTVTDSSNNAFSITKNSSTSTGWTSPYQTDGYWGNYFNGSSDYLSLTNSASLNPGTGNFTFECWVYFSSLTRGNIYDGANNGISVALNASNQLSFSQSNVAFILNDTVTPNLNQWYHLAISRSGTTLSMFKNGTRIATATNSTNFVTSTANRIGWNGITAYFNGYISNIRLIIGGTPIYDPTQTTITVPTSPLTAITNTALLTCQSNRFIDNGTANSGVGFPITVNGTPQVTSYWYPSGFTAPTASPGAGYFNGSTDYLNYTFSSAVSWTNAAFTVEAWVYPLASGNAIFSVSNSTDLTRGFTLYVLSSGLLQTDNRRDGSSIGNSNIAVKFNSWNHIAVTLSAAGGTLSYYVNGVAAGTSATGSFYNATSSNLFIGSRSTSASFYTGYISNLRFVAGTIVYTGNFTPPTAFLQTSGSASAASYPSTTNVNTSFAAANTSLLLNLADSNFISATNGVQNNTFIDSSNYAFPITRNGTPTQGSVTPYWPVGYWSNYFSGSSDRIQAAFSSLFQLGTNNFTIELWVYFNSVTTPISLSNQQSGPSNTTFNIYVGTTGTLQYYLSSNGSSWNIASAVSIGSISVGTWYHVALVRNGTTFTPYLNGVAGTTTTSSASIFASTAALSIGADGASVVSVLNGYISNYRFVNGTAVYTGAFTPPTLGPLAVSGAASAASYPSTTNVNTSFSSANTALLTCQSNRFVDRSNSPLAITVSGSPKVQAFQPLTLSASYTTAAYGGSGYFGSGTDNVTTPANTAFAFGTSDFTIEAWVYTTASGAIRQVFYSAGTSIAANGVQFFINASNQLSFTISFVAVIATSTGTISPNTWTHVAVTRSGTSLRLFINGNIDGTATNSTNIASTTTNYIGSNASSTESITGYISNLRIVKGTAVYTGAFTPPTLAPLTTAGSTSAASYSSTTNVNTSFAASSTSLLTNFTNAGIYDAAVQNNQITVGDAQASTTQSKWSPTSMKFDGTGDWLTSVDSPQLQLLSGDFTIEGWVYLSATGVAYGIISKGTASTGWSVNVTSGNKLQFSYTASNLTGATSLASGTWYYFAVVRSGSATGNLKLYLNGTVDATSGSAVTDNFNQTSILYVGADRIGTSPLNGYLQDVRITKGVARTITTPTTAFLTR